jgi:hypothetical protein
VKSGGKRQREGEPKSKITYHTWMWCPMKSSIEVYHEKYSIVYENKNLSDLKKECLEMTQIEKGLIIKAGARAGPATTSISNFLKRQKKGILD